MTAKKRSKSKPKTRKLKKKGGIPNVLKAAALITFLLIAGFLVYSALSFQASEEEKEGFYVCNPEGTVCELSQHVHADIELNACGEEITFPREAGRTDEMHTHKERNYMHWHSQINVDPVTQEPLPEERERLTVGAFLNQVGYKFPATCAGSSNPATVVMVNGEINENGLDYIWVDGDDIHIEYK